MNPILGFAATQTSSLTQWESDLLPARPEPELFLTLVQRNSLLHWQKRECQQIPLPELLEEKKKKIPWATRSTGILCRLSSKWRAPSVSLTPPHKKSTEKLQETLEDLEEKNKQSIIREAASQKRQRRGQTLTLYLRAASRGGEHFTAHALFLGQTPPAVLHLTGQHSSFKPPIARLRLVPPIARPHLVPVQGQQCEGSSPHMAPAEEIVGPRSAATSPWTALVSLGTDQKDNANSFHAEVLWRQGPDWPSFLLRQPFFLLLLLSFSGCVGRPWLSQQYEIKPKRLWVNCQCPPLMMFYSSKATEMQLLLL